MRQINFEAQQGLAFIERLERSLEVQQGVGKGSNDSESHHRGVA